MKTKQITIMLAIFMLFGFIFNSGVVYANNDSKDSTSDETIVPAPIPEDNSEKELVFLIDRSLFTDKNALANIKNQVTTLSDELLQSGKISITLIAFNGISNTLARKTKDLKKIENAFLYIRPFGFSNPTRAFDIANSLGYKNKKDIVLFTSVYPNIGPITNDGPYTIRDHFYFRNANSYKNSTDEISENTRLVSVTNFSRLRSRDAAFSKKVFEETSNKYYSADKMTNEELVSSLKDYILEDMDVKPVLKKPIVFVPDIFGSELYNIDDSLVTPEERATGMISVDKANLAKKIWSLNGGKSFFYDESDTEENTVYYGLQLGDLKNVSLSDINNSHTSVYAKLFETLKKNFPDRPIYLFSFDWRYSSASAANKLENFINNITDGGKVKADIIAQGMGGLVSAHYLENNDEKVDKYTSFGTPYEGVPAAFSLLTGLSILNNDFEHIINKYNIEVPDVPINFDSVDELVPTKNFLNKYHFYMLDSESRFEPISISTSTYKTYYDLDNAVKSYDRYADTLYDYPGPYRTGINYFRRNDKGEMFLMNRPNSMFFVGNGSPTTVSGYLPNNVDILGSGWAFPLRTLEGDGLVPTYSATMGKTLKEMTSEQRAKFMVGIDDHAEMLSNLATLQVMCNFLNESEAN